MSSLPVIVFCISGKVHLAYAIWSIGSLKKHGYKYIEIMVGSDKERALFSKYWPEIPCNVVSVNSGGYPSFSYKPFALTKYMDSYGLYYKGRDIVICDADILWRQDPAPLFRRFRGKNWVHKITAVNPNDYETPMSDVSKAYISLRTILNYRQRYPISIYPNFVVNAGLFMLSEEKFPIMLENWMSKILSLPAEEMLMSEALMALTYAEMGIKPTSDSQDIKHLGRHKQTNHSISVLSLEEAEPLVSGEFTGYQSAVHYFGSQRNKLHDDAVAMGLDHTRLVLDVRKTLRNEKIVKFFNKPINYFEKMFGINR